MNSVVGIVILLFSPLSESGLCIIDYFWATAFASIVPEFCRPTMIPKPFQSYM